MICLTYKLRKTVITKVRGKNSAYQWGKKVGKANNWDPGEMRDMENN